MISRLAMPSLSSFFFFYSLLQVKIHNIVIKIKTTNGALPWLNQSHRWETKAQIINTIITINRAPLSLIIISIRHRSKILFTQRFFLPPQICHPPIIFRIYVQNLSTIICKIISQIISQICLNNSVKFSEMKMAYWNANLYCGSFEFWEASRL